MRDESGDAPVPGPPDPRVGGSSDEGRGEDPAPSPSPLSGLALALLMLLIGVPITVGVGDTLLRSVAVLAWQTHSCEVRGTRVGSLPVWYGFGTLRQIELRVTLRDRDTGRVYPNAPVAPFNVSGMAHDTAAVLASAPFPLGAAVDCRVSPSGDEAVARADSALVVVFLFLGVVMGLVIAGGGVWGLLDVVSGTGSRREGRGPEP